MFEFKTLFDNFYDTFDTFDNVNNIAKQAEKVALPMNIIREEDGSSTVEVAVVGKTREDISVKGITENGNVYLVIESIEKEKTKDEKNVDEKRSYSVHKIKGTDKLSIKLFVPATFDINGATVKVENGLLTVKIPVAEEAKPITFEIK